MQPIIQAFLSCIEASLERGFWPFQLAFPEFSTYSITPYDRRVTRNNDRVKFVFKEMLDQHRREHASGKPINREWDFLDMMIHDQYFKDQDNDIIDEAITFFLAGMVSLKSATTNMLVYLVRQPNLKAKLIAEVD